MFLRAEANKLASFKSNARVLVVSFTSVVPMKLHPATLVCSRLQLFCAPLIH